MYGFEFTVEAQSSGLLDKNEEMTMTFLACHLDPDSTGIYTMDEWLDEVISRSQINNHEIIDMKIFDTAKDYEDYCTANNVEVNFYHKGLANA